MLCLGTQNRNFSILWSRKSSNVTKRGVLYEWNNGEGPEQQSQQKNAIQLYSVPTTVMATVGLQTYTPSIVLD